MRVFAAVTLVFAPLGCPSGGPVVKDDPGHPYSLGEEVLCSDPVTGFSRLEEQAEARGIRPDLGVETALSDRFPLGVGLAAVDGDGDGDIDLFFPRPDGSPQVFENDGSGHFSLVDQEVELPGGEGQGLAASFVLVDLNNDGLVDLVTLGHWVFSYAQNLGDLRFGEFQLLYLDSSSSVGATLSATWGDADGDGDLDLFLPGVDRLQYEVSGEEDEQLSSLDRLLWNTGEGFESGLTLGPTADGGLSMVAAFTDRDADGDLDLLVPGLRGLWGYPPSAFYRNDGLDEAGDLVMVDDAAEIGADLSMSAMGLASVDLNGDGHLDYCLTDLERLRCFLSDGQGAYFEGAESLGLVPPELEPGQGWSGWSIDLVDLDNDGWTDAVASAGYPFGLEAEEKDYSVQPNGLWRGSSEGFALDAGSTGFDEARSQYGLVTADLDGDGFVEVVISAAEGEVEAWWNQCGEENWLEVDLAGPNGNTAALNAVVELEAGGASQVAQVGSQRGFGQGPTRLHFGLGSTEEVAVLRVHWPDGEHTESYDIPTRRIITVPHPERLEGKLAADDNVVGGADLGDTGLAPAATLSGTVTRAVEPTGDGIGELFVGVFAESPMAGGMEPVAMTTIDVDFSSADAQVDYHLSTLGPREEPYFVLAYLDDNGSGVLTGLDSGDLVSMQSLGTAWTISMPEAEDYTLDLELNIIMIGAR